MRDFEFALEKLSNITSVEITCYAVGQFWDIYQRVSYNPLRQNEELLHKLIGRSIKQEAPVVYRDKHGVWFACIRQSGLLEDGSSLDAWFLIGPVSMRRLDVFELHDYYWDYGMHKGMEKPLTVISYSKWLSVIETAALVLNGEQYDDDEVKKANNLSVFDSEDIALDAETDFSMLDEEEFDYHHTYDEERRLLDCVREGRTDDALDMNQRMDQMTGRMSEDEYDQMKKSLVVAVTLCTRAAIDGGLSPTEAYRISDYYIMKGDKCRDIPSLVDCRNQAVRDLTDRVAKKKAVPVVSSYTAAACDYISKHYRDKIYLSDIADALGISPSYLSRLFTQEMGENLQNHVTKVRVDRAANLLAFSDEDISVIGDYVSFPSQSYFGKVFKKYKGMTPKEYRNRYKPGEFVEKKE